MAEPGKTMTLALETGFSRAVLSQDFHSVGPSLENNIQHVFPSLVNPESHGSECKRPKIFWRKKNKGRKWRRTDGLGSPRGAGPSAPRTAFGDGHPERRRLAPARANLFRRKWLTRRFAQQSRPRLSKASFD